jgi:hypothetical protein
MVTAASLAARPLERPEDFSHDTTPSETHAPQGRRCVREDHLGHDSADPASNLDGDERQRVTARRLLLLPLHRYELYGLRSSQSENKLLQPATREGHGKL